MRTLPFLLLSLVVLPLGTFADDEAPAAKKGKRGSEMPADMKVQDHILYKTASAQKLELMIIPPTVKKFEKAPLVVYIHGGGWGGGDRFRVLREDVLGVVRQLTALGFTCATIEYRLATPETPAINAAADCKDAVRFLSAHAKDYGIDPDRIGTFGSSAGGHLTLVTALGEDRDYPMDPAMGPPAKIRCVAAFFPATTFDDPEIMAGSNFANPRNSLRILGGPLEENKEVARKLSPLELVKAGSPPIFLAHGDADKTLNVRHSLALRDAAQAAGVPVECVISKGAGHGFQGAGISPSVPEIVEKTTAFFVKYLQP